MYAMRHRVSHGYDKVDLEILWKTIQADFPSLSNKITELSKEVHQNLDQVGFE